MIPDSYRIGGTNRALAISRCRVTRAADERRDFEELSERLGATAVSGADRGLAAIRSGAPSVQAGEHGQIRTNRVKGRASPEQNPRVFSIS